MLNNDPYSPHLALCEVNVFCTPMNVLKVSRSRSCEDCGVALVPAAAQEVLYRGNPLAVVTMGCLSQHPCITTFNGLYSFAKISPERGFTCICHRYLLFHSF